MNSMMLGGIIGCSLVVFGICVVVWGIIGYLRGD